MPFNLAVHDLSNTVPIATPGIIAAWRAVALPEERMLKLPGSLGYALMPDDTWSPAAAPVSGVEGFSARTALPDQLMKLHLVAGLVAIGGTSLSATYRADFGTSCATDAAEPRIDYRFCGPVACPWPRSGIAGAGPDSRCSPGESGWS